MHHPEYLMGLEAQTPPHTVESWEWKKKSCQLGPSPTEMQNPMVWWQEHLQVGRCFPVKNLMVFEYIAMSLCHTYGLDLWLIQDFERVLVQIKNSKGEKNTSENSAPNTVTRSKGLSAPYLSLNHHESGKHLVTSWSKLLPCSQKSTKGRWKRGNGRLDALKLRILGPPGRRGQELFLDAAHWELELPKDLMFWKRQLDA